MGLTNFDNLTNLDPTQNLASVNTALTSLDHRLAEKKFWLKKAADLQWTETFFNLLEPLL
jgi:hypothetical protein